MAILTGVLVMGLALILQMTVFSRITLLAGSPDLLLVILAAWVMQPRVKTAWHWAVIAGLMIGFTSAVPLFVPVFGYLAVIGLGYLLQRQVWQAPFLATLIINFIGTLVGLVLTFLVLQLYGRSLPFIDSFGLVILPGILLNLLLAFPIYYLVNELAQLIYPSEVEA